MEKKDFIKLRRDLDDAITYADFDLAEELAKKALTCAHEQEALGEMMYFRAQISIIDEDFETAIKYLNRAIRYNPKDGAAYNDRALCRIELDEEEDIDQILADFDKGIEVEPDYASIYHNRGWYLNQIGSHRKAIVYFKKALSLEPNRAVTYENLADAYLNLGKKRTAINAFRKAFQCLKPSYVDIKDQIEDKIKILIDGDEDFLIRE